MRNEEDRKNSGGYKGTPFFKQSEIIYDFTVEFCQKYIEGDKKYKSYKYYTRLSDQLIQAARSGKQNIAEGYLQKSFEGRLKLLAVARGSLEELLCDYQDFLRQKGLTLWRMDSSEAQAGMQVQHDRISNYRIHGLNICIIVSKMIQLVYNYDTNKQTTGRDFSAI